MIIYLAFAKQSRVGEDIRLRPAFPNGVKSIVLQGVCAGNMAILEIPRFFLLSPNLFGGLDVMNELNDFMRRVVQVQFRQQCVLAGSWYR